MLVERVLGIVCLLLALVAGVQTFRLSGAKDEIKSLTESSAAIKAQLEAQNAGIAALEKERARLLANSKRASKVAAQTTATAEAKAAAIEASPTPDTCEGAINLLISGVSQ